VTYGIFSTEKSARIALLQLPNTLRFNGAWIRQVGNVKRHLTIM
jgi:septal ring-binding cell division protein DamX